jgi:hypothetical protein
LIKRQVKRKKAYVYALLLGKAISVLEDGIEVRKE